MGKFQKVGVIGRHRAEHITETLKILLQFLQQFGQSYVLDEDIQPLLQDNKQPYLPRQTIAKTCDLLIIVGGDGSLLQAAQMAAEHQIPIVGINKGRLGFLTDILPAELEKKLKAVLQGIYIEERRFLIDASLQENEKEVYRGAALNDVVLLPGDIAHMIEFDIYINKQFVCTQRADGMIVATPTGSTAYALSGGGPILHPQLEALVLVSMFPHTLSNRPLVVQSDSLIEIVVSKQNETSPWLSCDGHQKTAVTPGSTITIRKQNAWLRLIHPEDYNYFETLRSKLNWIGGTRT